MENPGRITIWIISFEHLSGLLGPISALRIIIIYIIIIIIIFYIIIIFIITIIIINILGCNNNKLVPSYLDMG